MDAGLRTPRPYQEIGRDWILDRPRCAIWALPGAGKTGMVLLALQALYLLGEMQCALVIAPKRVAEEVWSEEVYKWPGLGQVLGQVVPIIGSPEKRAAALARRAKVYTVSYDNLVWLARRFDSHTWPFDVVIADEASKLRGFRLRQGTARPRALAPFAHTRIRRFIELTGTPNANHLHALWGQLWFLDGGDRLGHSFEAFKARWFYNDGERDKPQLEPFAHALGEITGKLKDLCLHIDPRDWYDMKAPVRQRVEVDLPTTARKHYRKMARDLVMELQAGQITVFNAGAKTMKLRQLANGAVFTDDPGAPAAARAYEVVHTAKLDALEDLIEELGETVIVSYAFVPDRKELLKRFPQAVDLATPKGLADFKAGRAPIGIAHPASVGHGINDLEKVCRTSIFYSHDWDAEGRLQLLDRTGPTRQMQAGLDRHSLVYDIVAAKTIDEVMVDRYDSKMSIQDALMQGMEKLW